ncbi:MAG TPA: TPM domain-containing protein [Aeromicrobium sp.]|nr:TPM domain-containing protein [Aeromicrobium sp.]
MRRALAGALTTLVMLASVAVGGIAPAAAVDPLKLKQQITDTAGALGNREPQVQEALDRFFDRTGSRLYVVYVPDFGSSTPAEWAAETAKKSSVDRTGVLLVFATKTRSFGHMSGDPDLTADGLDAVDSAQIRPALRNDDYAKATIDAADAYGDLAAQRPLPWGWIVTAIAVGLLVLLVYVRRSRRRFEHTHHVLDEHGNPVDPADILTLDEIDRTSAAALVAVDDALLTSAADVLRAAEQLGEPAVEPFALVVAAGRAAIDDAFRRRRKLDKLVAKDKTDDQTERKWRKRASRILATCEQVDGSLDANTATFDEMRDLKGTAAGLLDALEPGVAEATQRLETVRETYALLPTRAAAAVQGNVELATHLLRAATRQLEKRDDEAPTRLRAVEDALTTANELMDAVDEAEAHQGRSDAEWWVDALERYVASRRGAVGVRARTLRSEARRHVMAAHETDDPAAAEAAGGRAKQLAESGLAAAAEDVAAWQRGREESADPFGRRFDALVLAGILVDETDSGGLKTLLGGFSHGGGSGAPYRGIGQDGTLRTAGSFGGTTTRGRRGGF